MIKNLKSKLLILAVLGFFLIFPQPIMASLEADTIDNMCDLGVIGTVIDVIGMIPGVPDLDDDCEDSQEDARKAFCKKGKPQVEVTSIKDYYDQGNEQLYSVSANIQGFMIEASSTDELYYTWSIDGDYRFNTYLAGGEIKNRFGILTQFEDENGIYFKRVPEGGLGGEENVYNAWVDYYKQIDSNFGGDANEDYDQDGFQSYPNQEAPWGGLKGAGGHCVAWKDTTPAELQTQLSALASGWRYNCDAIGVSCTSIFWGGGHEFSKLRAVCPGGSGVVGEGGFNNCLEYTFGTNPLESVTEGDKTVPDGVKMTGAGSAGELIFDRSYVEEDSAGIEVFVEGRALGWSQNSSDGTLLLAKASNEKKFYDTDNSLKFEISILPEIPQEGEYFEAKIDFGTDNKNIDEESLEYIWKVTRKEDLTPGSSSPVYKQGTGTGYISIVYPNEEVGAINNGIYFVEAQACRRDNDKLSCGPWASTSVTVGQAVELALEGLIGDTFEPIETVIDGDLIRITASHPDGTLPEDYSYSWEVPEELVRVFDPEATSFNSPAVAPDSINGPKMVFKALNTVSQTQYVNVKAVAKDGSVKYGVLKFDIQAPEISVVPASGGGVLLEAGSVDRAQAPPSGGELSVLAGPAGSTFEKQQNSLAYTVYQNGQTTYLDSNSFSLISGEVGDLITVNAEAFNPSNQDQRAEAEPLFVKIEESTVAGASALGRLKSFLGRIGMDGISGWWWFLTGLLIFSGLGVWAGRNLAEKKFKTRRLNINLTS